MGSNEDNEEIRFGKTRPSGVYAFTNSTHEGIFKYSKNVYFSFVFVKPRSPSVPSTSVVGKLKGTTVFKKDIQFGGVSQWKRVYLEERALVDEIVIGTETLVDNLKTDFNYTEFENSLSNEDILKLIEVDKKSGGDDKKSDGLDKIVGELLKREKKASLLDEQMKKNKKIYKEIFGNDEDVEKLIKHIEEVRKDIDKDIKQGFDVLNSMKKGKKKKVEMVVLDMKELNKVAKKIEKNFDPKKSLVENLEDNMDIVTKFVKKNIKNMKTFDVGEKGMKEYLNEIQRKKKNQNKDKIDKPKPKEEAKKEQKEEKSIEPKTETKEPVMEFKEPVFKELTEEELKLLETEVSSEDVESVSLNTKESEKKKGEIKKKPTLQETIEKEDENMESDILNQIKSGDNEFNSEMEKMINEISGDEDSDDDEDY